MHTACPGSRARSSGRPAVLAAPEILLSPSEKTEQYRGPSSSTVRPVGLRQPPFGLPSGLTSDFVTLERLKGRGGGGVINTVTRLYYPLNQGSLVRTVYLKPELTLSLLSAFARKSQHASVLLHLQGEVVWARCALSEHVPCT